MPSFFQIVANTPLWVWPLMAFVLWLGLQGLRPRVIPVWRLAILPAVSLATSLGGIAQSANPAGAAAGWGLALIAFLPLGWAFGQGRPVRLRPEDGKLEIAGGWFALLLRPLDLRRALCDGRAVRRPAGAARRAAVDLCLRCGRRHGRGHRHRLARQPAAPRPSFDQGRIMRLIVLLVLVLSTSFAVLAQQRFDFKVREDMFAGMDGDTAAFDRAMKLIDDTLATDPNHAEALVWRGDGRLFLAGQAFQRGATADGQALAAQATADMDRAVALAPDNIAVRVPRAAGLLPFARGMRPFNRPEADRLTRTAIGDFEFVVAASTPRWSKLGEHGRGELAGRAGRRLADAWAKTTKANAYLDRMSSELPGTPYAKNAALRRADPAAKVPLTCLGCH